MAHKPVWIRLNQFEPAQQSKNNVEVNQERSDENTWARKILFRNIFFPTRNFIQQLKFDNICIIMHSRNHDYKWSFYKIRFDQKPICASAMGTWKFSEDYIALD